MLPRALLLVAAALGPPLGGSRQASMAQAARRSKAVPNSLHGGEGGEGQ